jgi:hypothetical protein
MQAHVVVVALFTGSNDAQNVNKEVNNIQIQVQRGGDVLVW